MTQGRSIRLFLVDGTPNGLLTAEIMSWSGQVSDGMCKACEWARHTGCC